MIKISKRGGRFAALIIFLFLITSCGQVLAYTYTAIDNSRRDYGSGATRKLGRGLANTGLGWTEVFKGMEDVHKESGFWAGATWGPFYGAANALKRTGAGIYETVTFPFAGPNRFDPILEPEFPLTTDS